MSSNYYTLDQIATMKLDSNEERKACLKVTLKPGAVPGKGKPSETLIVWDSGRAYMYEDDWTDRDYKEQVRQFDPVKV